MPYGFGLVNMDVISTSAEVSAGGKKASPINFSLYDWRDKNQWLTAALL